MKKIGTCIVCGRQVYTNDEHYCKRCYREAMVSGDIKADIAEEPKGSVVIEE